MKLTKGYGREAGMIAWALTIASGIAMGVYLLMNALLIMSLAAGESFFAAVVQAMVSPWVMIAEMVVFVLVLYHICNGIRILFFDVRLWVEDQKDIFYVALIAVIVIFAFHFIPLLERHLR